MLTADPVDARRKDGELLLRPLDAEGESSPLIGQMVRGFGEAAPFEWL